MQEYESHTQSLYPPHSCPCSWLSRVVVSDCKWEFVKSLEWLFGLFRLPRGISRKTRHWRWTAWAQYGMCKLARHGTAGARHGMRELAFSLSVMPCSTVSSLASRTRSSACFTVQITCPSSLKSPKPSRTVYCLCKFEQHDGHVKHRFVR